MVGSADIDAAAIGLSSCTVRGMPKSVALAILVGAVVLVAVVQLAHAQWLLLGTVPIAFVMRPVLIRRALTVGVVLVCGNGINSLGSGATPQPRDAR